MSARGGQWWLATLGRHIAWARLRVREAGTAEVFDSDDALRTRMFVSLAGGRAAH